MNKHIFFASFCPGLVVRQKPRFKVLSIVIRIQLEHVMDLKVLNIKHIKYLSQPSHICYWWKVKEGWLMLQGKFYCYSAPTHHTHELFFFLCSISFFRFHFLGYWDHYGKFSGCGSFDSFKKYNPNHPKWQS